MGTVAILKLFSYLCSSKRWKGTSNQNKSRDDVASRAASLCLSGARRWNDAESKWHVGVVESITDIQNLDHDDDIDPALRSKSYGACSAGNVSRLVFYGGSLAFVFSGLALAKYSFATLPAVIFFAFAIYGCCGFCHFDLLGELRKPEGDVIYTSIGCTRRSNVAVGSVFCVVFFVFIMLVNFIPDISPFWYLIVVLLSLVVCVVACISSLCLRCAVCCQGCNRFDCCCCNAVDIFFEDDDDDDDETRPIAPPTHSPLYDDDDDATETSGLEMGTLRQPTNVRQPSMTRVPSVENPFRLRRRTSSTNQAEKRRVTDDVELRIDLRFVNLGLRLRANGQTVLNGVSGTIDSGCVTAIMGPSGAGKT